MPWTSRDLGLGIRNRLGHEGLQQQIWLRLGCSRGDGKT